MKRRGFLGFLPVAMLLASCGSTRPEPGRELDPDPYRPVRSQQINAVLYATNSPTRLKEQLATLGVRIGMDFGEFKESSGIDDWFGGETGRQTSLTCGLSPEIDAGGYVIALYRSRKLVAGKMHEELLIATGS